MGLTDLALPLTNMPDSIYDQVLTIAAPQIKTLADAIEFYLTKEIDLRPRKFSWKDAAAHTKGVSLWYSAEGARRATVAAPLNSHNCVGFNLYLLMIGPQGANTRDAEAKAFESLKQSIRQYYHHRRRMETVSSPGVLTTVSTVEDGGPAPPADLATRFDIQMQTITFWFDEPQTA